jgi:hypothetical protein
VARRRRQDGTVALLQVTGELQLRQQQLNTTARGCGWRHQRVYAESGASSRPASAS